LASPQSSSFAFDAFVLERGCVAPADLAFGLDELFEGAMAGFFGE